MRTNLYEILVGLVAGLALYYIGHRVTMGRQGVLV